MRALEDSTIYKSRNFVKNGNIRGERDVSLIYKSRNFVKNGNILFRLNLVIIYKSRNFVKNGNKGGGGSGASNLQE